MEYGEAGRDLNKGKVDVNMFQNEYSSSLLITSTGKVKKIITITE